MIIAEEVYYHQVLDLTFIGEADFRVIYAALSAVLNDFLSQGTNSLLQESDRLDYLKHLVELVYPEAVATICTALLPLAKNSSMMFIENVARI